ncbi:MAG: iron ABC transporter permease [Desulfoprunum sp.]|nr:iron ABC transporter permease [Desulfoprunum sp.]
MPNHKKLFGTLGVVLLLWFLVGYILYPALKTVEVSLTDHGTISLIHYSRFFTSDASIAPLTNSIVLGLLTVIVCGLIGTALAFFVHYFDFPGKNIVDKLLLMPLILPGIVIVFAFVQLYGESGLVTKSIEWLFGLESKPYSFSGLKGILFVHAYTQYVYFYISVSIAIRHIDYSVIESARNLGAAKTKIFTSVILPFITPALISSAIITFISGIGSFTAPSIIGGGYRVLTTQILLSKANNYMEVAATQVVILTGISLFLFSVFRLYEKKAVFTSSVKGVSIQVVTIKNPLIRFLMLSTAGILIVTILLPVFAIILLSFVESETLMMNIFPQEFTCENYLDIFTSARKFAPFLNSIVMALLASLLGLVIAIPSSYLIVKTQIKLKWLIEILVMLPWAMPASAIAINIINAYNTPNIFSFNSVLVGTFILLPLGYFVRSIPLMVKTTSISFQNLNETYIEASKSLGASRFQTFTRIVLPMISPGLVAGFLLVFVRSIGEYTLSVFLYTPSNKPVSIAVVNGIFEYNIGLAMAYGALLILVTSALSFLISKFSTALSR